MSAPDTPVRGDPTLSIEPPASTVRGVWLTAGPVHDPIQRLLLELLAPNQPNAGLREALLEELGRPAVDPPLEATPPCQLVAPKPGPDPWQEALVTPGGDCLLGFVVDTSDQ